ncbi:uncharacterized protein V6R79_024812 [Siganus canaliculatus]
MPSTQKIRYFLSSAVAVAISVGILGFAMSTSWSKTTVQCALNISSYAIVTLEPFGGRVDRVGCPPLAPDDTFEVGAVTKLEGAPAALHGVVLFLLVVSILSSACTILIALYNSVSNPYETCLGPIGIYTCSSISICFSLLALILFVVNVCVTDIADRLAKELAGSSLEMSSNNVEMQVGFYLIIPYVVLTSIAIGLIYAHTHAAYTHRKEQQKPTEDAPKEIMLY